MLSSAICGDDRERALSTLVAQHKMTNFCHTCNFLIYCIIGRSSDSPLHKCVSVLSQHLYDFRCFFWVSCPLPRLILTSDCGSFQLMFTFSHSHIPCHLESAHALSRAPLQWGMVDKWFWSPLSATYKLLSPKLPILAIFAFD